MRASRVLARLRDGKPAICTKMNLTDPRCTEIIGLVGFDCLWICDEHIPNDWSTIEALIRTAKLYDMDSLVRISKGSYSSYIKPLEADASGIMVPHIFSAQEAREVVKTTKFMPIGRRPIDGGNADGEYCRVPMEEYIEFANRERFTIIQIEDPEPMQELDQICATEGIDVVFFGPGDFSHAIGRIGQATHPDVVGARRQIAEACRKHNKWAGIPANLENIEDLMEEGFSFFSIGADVVALGQYFSSIRQGLEKLGLMPAAV